jgi:cytochrome d ubiquinol oxidase subunit II
VSFAAQYITPWLAPFPLSIGVMTLACFAFLAATYLTLEAPAGALREDFRRRALASGVAVGAAALVALVTAGPSAPLMRHGLVGSRWALPFQLITGVVAMGALAALLRRRYALARVAVMLQVSLVLWGWAWSQYPYVVPPDITIASAAAPLTTLQLVIVALVLGALVLVPSLFYLFRVFKSGDRPSAVSHP